MQLVAAISLGFLGSFHCLGMCGPIALALPVHQLPAWKRYLSVLAYNLGRMTSYAALGALFGTIGQGASFFGVQQILSVILGSLLLLGVLVPQSWLNRYRWSAGAYRMFARLKDALSAQFRKRGIRSLFSIGLLNGLLPCGLVYIAIAASVAAGSILQASLFMACFGLGTLPLMVAVTLSSSFFGVRSRTCMRKAMPFVVAATALMLILRGSNLGIPYLSPKLNETKTNAACHSTPAVSCCHKK